MAIQIYNSQTRKKEDFQTVEKDVVRMYVCGPTVYDFLHVGNYRGAIFYNAMRNWLERRGYKVIYVYNYTDVDDKIINRANEEGTSPREIAAKFIQEFETDYKHLKLRPHTHNPRATENIDNMIAFIEKLVAKGCAYELDGDVYFNVNSFAKYGELSNKKVEDLLSGHRIEVDQRKNSPADFALWKSAKEGEESWDSPWGKGRPGWHIECSVMATNILGDTIDVHGGGLDLLFPHHENEKAQSEACTGHPFVRYWVHNNMLEFGSQKMSKSLGNVRTGRSFIQEYNGEILKFMMLNAHYRGTIDFSEEQVDRAINSLAKFYSALAFGNKLLQQKATLAPLPANFEKSFDEVRRGFDGSMDDDFNTAEAIAKLFELTRVFNNLTRKPKFLPEHKAIAEVYTSFMKDRGSCLALFQEDPSSFLKTLDDMLLAKKALKREDIDQLVSERAKARDQKDWSRSDEIRDELVQKGIAVMDTAEGTTWEVAK